MTQVNIDWKKVFAEYKILPEYRTIILQISALPEQEKQKILQRYYDCKAVLPHQKLYEALGREVVHIPSTVEDGLHYGKLQGLFMGEADLVATLILAALGEKFAIETIRKDLEKRERNRELMEDLKKIIPEYYMPNIFIAWRGYIVAEMLVPKNREGRYVGMTWIEPIFYKREDGSIYARFGKDSLVKTPHDKEIVFKDIEELKEFFKKYMIEVYDNGWHDWVRINRNI